MAVVDDHVNVVEQSVAKLGWDAYLEWRTTVDYYVFSNKSALRYFLEGHYTCVLILLLHLIQFAEEVLNYAHFPRIPVFR